MLRPIVDVPEEKRRINMNTFDFEWNRDSPKRLRLAGTFDGKRYRRYNSMKDFFANEFVAANHNRRFYAHNMGASDIEFIFEEIVKTGGSGLDVHAAFSGASAIIVEIRKGGYKWTLVDSLWTIRASLRDIGQWIGERKGEVDFDTSNIHELTEYNEQDCLILYKALKEMERIMIDLGSELGMTASGTGLRLFRRQYLGRDPKTKQLRDGFVGIETSPKLNDRIRSAFMGGRTEPWDHRRGLSGCVYDVQSAYPAAMQFAVPGALLRSTTRLPKPSEPVEWIADVTVNVPENIKVPPLPRQAEGSLFFDVGPRRHWYTKPELENAEALGCEVLKVHECLVFEPLYDLAECSMDLFNKRQDEKKRGAGKSFLSQTYKLVNNGLYGKTAERAEKTAILINPSPEEMRRARTFSRYEKGALEPICPGVWKVTERARVRHAHVPIAAYITARARVNLCQHLLKTEPYYCDTDSVACGDWNIPVGENLGDLQLEKEFIWAYFRAPKQYMMQLHPKFEAKLRREEEGATERPFRMPVGLDAFGEKPIYIPGQMHFPLRTDIEPDAEGQFRHGSFERTLVRAKGFQRPDAGMFRKFDLGDQVEVRSMLMKPMEMFKAGLIEPQEKIRMKRVLDRVRPKRRPLSDGRTVPWHVRDFDVPYSVWKEREFREEGDTVMNEERCAG